MLEESTHVKAQPAPTLPRPTVDIEAIFDANQRVLQAAVETQARMLRGMAKVNGEVRGFIGRRVECDRVAARRLAACRTPQDAITVYQEFIESALNDYSAEIGLLAGICVDHAGEAVEEAEHRIEAPGGPAAAHAPAAHVPAAHVPAAPAPVVRLALSKRSDA
ncbi:MAG: phasin family protein [Paracoccaceae bacterium]